MILKLSILVWKKHSLKIDPRLPVSKFPVFILTIGTGNCKKNLPFLPCWISASCYISIFPGVFSLDFKREFKRCCWCFKAEMRQQEVTSQLFGHYAQHRGHSATATQLSSTRNESSGTSTNRNYVKYTAFQHQQSNTLSPQDAMKSRCYESAIELQERCARTKGMSYLWYGRGLLCIVDGTQSANGITCRHRESYLSNFL